MSSPSAAESAPSTARATTTLQGSLDSFPVTDLLRLLSTSKRSGRLVIRPAQPLWLQVAAGAIVLGGAASPMTLGRNLLARGAVSAEQLEQWFSLSAVAQGTTALHPLDVLSTLSRLADDSEVSPNALQYAVADACVATVVDMLDLPERDEAGDPIALVFTETEARSVAPRFALATEDVVAEALRQHDYLREASQRLGGPETRFRRTRRISADIAPLSIDALEWAALAELDDRATVAQLSHRLGLGRARTYEVLDRFVTNGLVEPA